MEVPHCILVKNDDGSTRPYVPGEPVPMTKVCARIPKLGKITTDGQMTIVESTITLKGWEVMMIEESDRLWRKQTNQTSFGTVLDAMDDACDRFVRDRKRRKMTSLIHDAINSGVDPVELCMNGGLVVDTDNDTWYA